MTLLTKNNTHTMRPFDQFFRNGFLDLLDRDLETVPSVNISENKDSYLIEMAVPGMKKDDFDIDVKGNMVTISCEKESESKDGKGSFARREYNYSSFSRSFTIPDNADTNQVSANYADGLLKLKISKKPEAQKSDNRKIRIE